MTSENGAANSDVVEHPRPIQFQTPRLDGNTIRQLLQDATSYEDIPEAIDQGKFSDQLIKSAISAAANRLETSPLNAQPRLDLAVAASERANHANPLPVPPWLVRVAGLIGLLLIATSYLPDATNSQVTANIVMVILSVAILGTAIAAAILAQFGPYTPDRFRSYVADRRWLLVTNRRRSQLNRATLLMALLANGVLLYSITTRGDQTQSGVGFFDLAVIGVLPMIAISLTHLCREEWISPHVFRTEWNLTASVAATAASLMIPLGLWVSDIFDESTSLRMAYPTGQTAAEWGIGTLIGAALLGVAISIGQNRTYLVHVSNQARNDAYSLLLEMDVAPALREFLDRARPNQERTFIADTANATGLSEAFDPELQVPTSSLAKIEALMKQTQGGAIGLAGPRGIGKSAVLWRLCNNTPGLGSAIPQGQPDRVGVLLAAPTKYHPREFLVQLYIATCEAVIDMSSRSADRPRRIIRQPVSPTVWLPRLVRLLIGASIGMSLIAAGAAVSGWEAPTDSRILIAAPLVTSGLLLMVATVMSDLSYLLRRRSDLRAANNPKSHVLVDWGAGWRVDEIAMNMLRRLTTEQTVSSTAATGIKPFIFEVGMETSFQQATREMYMPELVASFRDFLKRVARDWQLVVGIDELDKLETDDSAVDFLNEIKGVFGVKGAYFIISVSEDALSSFDRRGLPMRNAFDSAFDDVVRLDALTVEESSLLISRRAIGVPVPFKHLLHALSSGIPRELIRNCRALVDLAERASRDDGKPDGISLYEAAAGLALTDFERKLLASPAALKERDIPGRERLAELALKFRDQVHTRKVNSQTVETLAAMQGEMSSVNLPAGEARAVASELAVFLYYSRTIIDVFGDVANAQLGPLSKELAIARAEMAQSLASAWQRISRVRSLAGRTTEAAPGWLGKIASEE